MGTEMTTEEFVCTFDGSKGRGSLVTELPKGEDWQWYGMTFNVKREIINVIMPSIKELTDQNYDRAIKVVHG